MEHKQTGCGSSSEAPILCTNNCGFFGSAATMNMCSKCHKNVLTTQLAASSFINDNSNGKEPIAVNAQVNLAHALALDEGGEGMAKESSTRCSTCRKRVGLTGFSCRCGNLFCSVHRYSDKHECSFDYRTAARDAIAKGNPVIKAEKLEKI